MLSYTNALRIMSIANKDGEIKREDPIAPFKNPRVEYISSSRLSILAVVEEQLTDVHRTISRIKTYLK